jgi:hypothetical protein
MTAKDRPPYNPKKIGRNIVQSWFNSVINPLLHGLASEQKLLAKQNWTWRFEQEGLLSIAHVESSIAFEALDTLEQFLNLGPEGVKDCRSRIDRHNEQVDRLTGLCRALHSAIRDSPELAAVYQSARQDVSLLRQPGQDFNSLFGAYPLPRHLDVLAEDIVNATGLLPNYYTTAPLWNKYRDELLEIRQAPGIRLHWESCRKTGAKLEIVVDQLISSLKLIRQDLSLEHDLPLVQASPV